MLGPASGGGVVPALAVFDPAGDAVLDAGFEGVGVLGGAEAAGVGGEVRDAVGVVVVGEGDGRGAGDQRGGVAGAVVDVEGLPT